MHHSLHFQVRGLLPAWGMRIRVAAACPACWRSACSEQLPVPAGLRTAVVLCSPGVLAASFPELAQTAAGLAFRVEPFGQMEVAEYLCRVVYSA